MLRARHPLCLKVPRRLRKVSKKRLLSKQRRLSMLDSMVKIDGPWTRSVVTPTRCRSLRECGHDPAPVTAHNALFSSYKTARVHLASRRCGSYMAARGARAAGGGAGDRVSPPRITRRVCVADGCFPP